MEGWGGWVRVGGRYGGGGGGAIGRDGERSRPCWKGAECLPPKAVQGVPWSWASPAAVVSSDVQPGLRERCPALCMLGEKRHSLLRKEKFTGRISRS